MAETVTEASDRIDGLIRRAAQMVAFGVDRDAVRDFLIGEGLCEGEVYLLFTAAKLFADGPTR